MSGPRSQAGDDKRVGIPSGIPALSCSEPFGGRSLLGGAVAGCVVHCCVIVYRTTGGNVMEAALLSTVLFSAWSGGCSTLYSGGVYSGLFLFKDCFGVRSVMRFLPHVCHHQRQHNAKSGNPRFGAHANHGASPYRYATGATTPTPTPQHTPAYTAQQYIPACTAAKRY